MRRRRFGGFVDVDEDDEWRLGGCAGGFPALPSEAGCEGEGRPSVSGGAALLCGSQHHLAGAAGAVRALEYGMAAFSPSEPFRGVRGLFRHAGGFEQHGAPGSDVRFDRDPRACIGGRRKRGQQGQALGRSRGGFSTKIHLKTDFDGLPIAFDLTGGEAADSPHFETLMDIGPDVRPRAIVADKGYDSAGNRQLARKRGALTVIPYRKNIKNRPKRFASALYRGRARIEQAVGKLKRFSIPPYACLFLATDVKGNRCVSMKYWFSRWTRRARTTPRLTFMC